MKKLLLSVAAMLCLATTVSAQTFDADSQVITLGVGVGVESNIPVTVSYEHGIHSFSDVSHIGIGGLLGFNTHKNDNVTTLGAIAHYHYTGVNDFDFYGGLQLGYNIVSKDVDSDYNDLFLGLRAGARYYFNDNWAVNADLGYGLAVLNIGASYKF